jgi:hypothetical protein
MANTKFQFKRTTISGRLPNTTNSSNSSYIDAGEFAVNLTDGKVVSSNGSATFEVGANLSSLNVTGNILLANNNTKLQFTPTSGAANVYFIQQNDDNFVFYTTSNTGSARAVFSIYGNSSPTAQAGAIRFDTGVDMASSGLWANNSLGTSGQVLTSNGAGVYWAGASGGGSATLVTQQFTANGTANSFTISGGYTPNQVAVFVNGVKQIPVTDVDITSGTTINLASTPLNGYSVDVFGYNAVIPGSLTTANTATYLSNSSGTLLNIQNYITGNAATAYTNATSYADTKAATAYSNAVANAAALYQTAAGLSANVATLTANAATYVGNSSGTIGNITSWITGNAATAYSNAVANAAALYQTTAGLSANVATLTANAATYVGNSSGTIGNITSWITGNAATAYSNATSYVTAGGYTVSGIVNYSGNVILTSGNGTNQLLLGTVNATSIGMLVNSTVLTTGNNTVNTTISAAATALFTPTIRGSRETVLANTNASGAMTLDLSYGIHRWTVTGNVTSINFTNVPANNIVFNGTLYVTASATGTNSTNRAITFPSVANATTGKTLWSGASAPPQTSSNGSLDIYTFATIDGGNNYVWSLAVKDAR